LCLRLTKFISYNKIWVYDLNFPSECRCRRCRFLPYRTYPRRDYARTSNRGTIAMIAVALVLLILIFVFKSCGSSAPAASSSKSSHPSSVKTSTSSQAVTSSKAPSSAVSASSAVSVVSGGADHVSIVSATSPVKSGDSCTITILGKANRGYVIAVYFAEGIQPGLGGTKKTDANGNASWTFTVFSKAKKPGTYKITVKDTVSGETVEGQIVLQ